MTGRSSALARGAGPALVLAVVVLLLLVSLGGNLGPNLGSVGSPRVLPAALAPGGAALRTAGLPVRGLLPPAVAGRPAPVLHLPTTFAAPLAGVPALGVPPTGVGPLASDPSNPELDNYSSTTSVAAPGPSPSDVVVGATDATDESTGDHYFWTHGFDAVFRSGDAGSTWSTAYLGQNSSWASSTSASYGDLNFGEPSLAGADGTVLYADIYAQPCLLLPVNCNSTASAAAPGGIAVARSTNSGVTWGAPAAVNALPWYFFAQITCNGSFASGYLPANESDKPSVAYSAASNVAVVGWDVLDYEISLFCVGTAAYYQIDSLTELAEVSVSLNGGISWSAPTVLAQEAAGLPTVSIGPPPTDTISYAYADYVNGTASTYSIGYRSSTDNGSTWSTPVDLGPRTLVSPVNASVIGFPTALTDPVLAADNFTTSPFAGSVYVTWDENRSVGGGTPSVALLRSSNGGESWSSVSYPAAGTAQVQYLEPTVAVGPSGTVWITEYAQNRSTHSYQWYGEFSTDGGNSWTPPFAISDTAGHPGANTLSLGTWTGAAATSAGLFSAWTDCRWSGCSTSDEEAVYAAHTQPVAIVASVANITVTVASSGGNVSGPSPFATGFDAGALARVEVASWALQGNTSQYVAQFHNFTGIDNATVDPVAFDFSGGTTLWANYQQSPAGWIAGTVAPLAAAPSVTVGGTPVLLTPYNATALAFNVTEEAGGIYTVVASASDYATAEAVVASTAFHASTVTLTLAREAGWIRGRITPATATVRVNNTVVGTVDPVTGLFNVSEPWGVYWVNASGPGLTSYARLVDVLPGTSDVLNIGLVGSWLAGTVAPGQAAVAVDGTPVTVTNGSFNVSLLGGAHTVTASLTNYAAFRTVVTLTPGSGEVIAIYLTDLGWVHGTVTPVTASVSVGGVLAPVIDGAFNVSVRGNATYNVTASAVGFLSAYALVHVTAALGSTLNFSLVQVAPTCTVSCGGGSGGTKNLSLGSAAGAYSLGDVAVVAVVLLGAAAVGAFLLLRPPAGPRPEDDTMAPRAAPAADRGSDDEAGDGTDDMIYGEDRSAPEPWLEGEDRSQGLQPPR